MDELIDESFLVVFLVNIQELFSTFSKLSISLVTKVRQYLNPGGAFCWSKFKIYSWLIGVLHDGCVLHDCPLFSWAGVVHKLLLLRVSKYDFVEIHLHQLVHHFAFHRLCFFNLTLSGCGIYFVLVCINRKCGSIFESWYVFYCKTLFPNTGNQVTKSRFC